MPTAEPKKAARRSPAAIARERLDGARTRLQQKRDKRDRLQRELDTTVAEVAQIEREVAYLEQNPYLTDSATEKLVEDWNPDDAEDTGAAPLDTALGQRAGTSVGP